jgi:hypothetical protein
MQLLQLQIHFANKESNWSNPRKNDILMVVLEAGKLKDFI